MSKHTAQISDKELDSLIVSALERRESEAVFYALNNECAEAGESEKRRAYKLYEARLAAEKAQKIRCAMRKNRAAKLKRLAKLSALSAMIVLVLAVLCVFTVPELQNELKMKLAKDDVTRQNYIGNSPGARQIAGSEISDGDTMNDDKFDEPEEDESKKPETDGETSENEREADGENGTQTELHEENPGFEATEPNGVVGEDEAYDTLESELAPDIRADEEHQESQGFVRIENRTKRSFEQFYLYRGDKLDYRTVEKRNTEPIGIGDTITVTLTEEEIENNEIWRFVMKNELDVMERMFFTNGFKLGEVMGKTLVLTNTDNYEYYPKYSLEISGELPEDYYESLHEILGSDCVRIENRTGVSIMECSLGYSVPYKNEADGDWLFDGQSLTFKPERCENDSAVTYTLRIIAKPKQYWKIVDGKMYELVNTDPVYYTWQIEDVSEVLGKTLIFETDNSGGVTYRVI